jgi:hypothetical protein
MAPFTAFAAPAGVVAKSAFFGTKAAACSAARPVASTLTMLYGKPRPVQIIPSVLPADWANMGAECKRLEDAGVDRIQVRMDQILRVQHDAARSCHYRSCRQEFVVTILTLSTPRCFF